MEMSPCDGGIAGFNYQGTLVAELPAIQRVAPAAGALAPDIGTDGSILSDWVALPPRNNQMTIRDLAKEQHVSSKKIFSFRNKVLKKLREMLKQ